MKNPLRTEAEAFRFLIAVVLGALVIAVAAAINRWAGVGAAVIVLGVVARWYLRSPSSSPPAPRLRSLSTDDTRRILVVANETVGGGPLRAELERRVQGPTEVLVVTPALTSHLKHWTSDVDGARAAAEERLEASVARLSQTGLDVRGEVGDQDPLVAIEDALRTFGASEIIISTHPKGRSHWLEEDLIEKARARFAVPITHVVVDLTAEPS